MYVNVLTKPHLRSPCLEERAVLYYCEGRLIVNFGRAPLLGSDSNPRSPKLPPLSEAQHEALNFVEEVARSIELEIETKPGDIHFINNLAIMHRREAFVNGVSAVEPNDHDYASRDDAWATGTRKGSAFTHGRHLVRLRLRSSTKAGLLPKALREPWEKAFGEDGVEPVWHIEPMPTHTHFPLRKHPN